MRRTMPILNSRRLSHKPHVFLARYVLGILWFCVDENEGTEGERLITNAVLYS